MTVVQFHPMPTSVPTFAGVVADWLKRLTALRLPSRSAHPPAWELAGITRRAAPVAVGSGRRLLTQAKLVVWASRRLRETLPRSGLSLLSVSASAGHQSLQDSASIPRSAGRRI